MTRKKPSSPSPWTKKWLDPAQHRSTTKSPLDVDGIDYIEIFAANGRLTSNFYAQSFGFKPIAYRGPETGYREAATYVLKQGKIHLIITSPLSSSHWMSAQVMVHGDTVKDVAFQVPDCEAFYYEAMRRGAQNSEPPTIWEDSTGFVKRAGIKTYGDVVHSIVERSSYKGCFWPGFEPYENYFPKLPGTHGVGFAAVDHVVGNVALGDMNRWVDFYEKVLGFKEMLHFTEDDISTEYSALMSKVVRNGSGKVKFPINEPAKGRKRSQIDEYLEFHNGAGVQHIALITGDIIKTVSELRARGVGFLSVPKTYYDGIETRVGKIKEDMKKIADLGILVDRDDDGYLLQLFTKPMHDRPTLFFEIIQRRGSKGFGVGNFKALFESIEREQALRGNL